MFRISRTRFQSIMEDFEEYPFYKKQVDAIAKTGVSYEAKLLPSLKTLAYGVPSHCFRDYFQMSRALAGKCCKEFQKTIISHYQKKYKRIPDEADYKISPFYLKPDHQGSNLGCRLFLYIPIIGSPFLPRLQAIALRHNIVTLT
jgi:hypothetical protein